MAVKDKTPLTQNTTFRTTIGTAIAAATILTAVIGGYADTSKDIAIIEGRVEKIEESNKQNNEDIQEIKLNLRDIKKDLQYIIEKVDELKKRR
jgi:hypothetical protein